MNKTVYIGIIKNDECDVKTIVSAENEEDALKQVLEKFKDSLSYTEKDITIVPFSENFGGKSV